MTRRLLPFGLLPLFGLLLGMLASMAGCQIIDGGTRVDDGFGDAIWVSQVFTGGEQCNPDASYDPPDTEKDLEDAGAGVLDTVIEMHGVCEACIVCPTYSATHFAQIRESNLQRAQRLGYELSDGPADEG